MHRTLMAVTIALAAFVSAAAIRARTPHTTSTATATTSSMPSDAPTMMKTHLSTTTDEVVARLNKNWDADVRAFDAVYDHILHLGDALSDGIVKQFPANFS